MKIPGFKFENFKNNFPEKWRDRNFSRLKAIFITFFFIKGEVAAYELTNFSDF